MDNLFSSIKQQLCCERNLITNAYDILSLMNSEFPRELFYKQQGDFIITYYYSRLSRMREFNKVTDEMINEIYKYRHYNYLIQNQFDKIMQSISMCRSLEYPNQNNNYQITDIKDISVMFKFLELDYFRRNNMVKNNISQKTDQELMSQLTDKQTDIQIKQQENLISNDGSSDQDNNLNMNIIQNSTEMNKNEQINSQENSQNSLPTLTSLGQFKQDQEIKKQENIYEELQQNEEQTLKVNNEIQFQQQSNDDVKFEELIKRITGNEEENSKQIYNEKLDKKISDKDIDEMIQLNSQRAIEYFNQFKKKWNFQDIEDSYFEDCRKNSVFHDILGKEQIKVIQEYEKTLNSNRSKVKKTIRKQFQKTKNIDDLSETNQKIKKLKKDLNRSDSAESQIKIEQDNNLPHLEQINGQDNSQLISLNINNLQTQDKQILQQQQQQNIEQLQKKKKNEKKIKNGRLNKKNNAVKNGEEKGQLQGKEKVIQNQDAAVSNIQIESQQSNGQQINLGNYIQQTETIQIDNESLLKGMGIKVFNNEQNGLEVKNISQTHLNQNEQILYQVQLNLMKLLKENNIDQNSLQQYYQNFVLQQQNQLNNNLLINNIENIQYRSALNQQNDYNQQILNQYLIMSNQNQFQSSILNLNGLFPQNTFNLSNKFQTDVISPEQIDNKKEAETMVEDEKEQQENQRQEDKEYLQRENLQLNKIEIEEQDKQDNFKNASDSLKEQDYERLISNNSDLLPDLSQNNKECEQNQNNSDQQKLIMNIDLVKTKQQLKQINEEDQKLNVQQEQIIIEQDSLKQEQQFTQEKQEQNIHEIDQKQATKMLNQICDLDHVKSPLESENENKIKNHSELQQSQYVQQLDKQVNSQLFQDTNEITAIIQKEQVSLIEEVEIEGHHLNLQSKQFNEQSEQFNENKKLDGKIEEEKCKQNEKVKNEENKSQCEKENDHHQLLTKKSEQIKNNEQEQTSKQNIQSDMCLESPSMNDIEDSQCSDMVKEHSKMNSPIKVNINDIFVYPVNKNQKGQTKSNNQKIQKDNKIESPSSNEKEKKKKLPGKTFKELTQEELEILKSCDKKDASSLAKKFGMSYQTMRKSIIKLQNNI